MDRGAWQATVRVLQSQTRRKQLIKGFLGGTGGKEPPASAGDIKRHKLDP